jgi:tRNA 2-selenouridine synthase
MAFELTSLSQLLSHGFDTVIDVRSPAEYAEDHLPGAINLPALSDDERARVGTIYKQDSPFRARKIGAALVARNVAAHLDGPLADRDGGWRPLVYCWRGGQRSGSVATILREVGWRVEVVKGGYRTFRREVVASLYDRPIPHRVVVLDGYTGTAKTALLARLQALGVQVLDLEGMANHRGSVLGPRAGGQPSQKAFETALAMGLAACDPARPMVVEAESSKIGDLILPPEVWKAMSLAPRIEVEAPVAARAAYLARAYADLTAETAELVGRLELLIPLQGRERVAHWAALAQAGEHETLAAELVELHYDPRYAKSRGRFANLRAATVRADSLDDAALDRLAAEIARAVAATLP